MAGKNEATRIVDVVTGASSALGVELAKKLLDRGHEVRAVLKLNPKVAEEWKGIPAGVRPYIADITLPSEEDRKNLHAAMAGADNVFHLAAAVYNYKNSVDMLMNVNVVGTENLLTAIAAANSRRTVHVLFASTVSIYGYGRRGELLRENSEPKPKTPYGRSKYIAEQLLQSYCMAHKNIRYTTMRLGTIYGEGYEHPSFCKVFRLIKEGRMQYIGRGENHLTLINVHDAVDAFLLAVDKPSVENRTYNLTDGEAYTQKVLFSTVSKYLKVDSVSRSVHPIIAKMGRVAKKINVDEFDFLASDRTISIERIRKELHFSPKAKMSVEGVHMIDECLNKD